MNPSDMFSALRRLYAEQLAEAPDDVYLQLHGSVAYVNGAVETFRFYQPYLPQSGRILDWGCHHAPEACMIRMHGRDCFEIEGCDVHGPEQYRRFYEFAGLRYIPLTHLVTLPYEDASFDAIVGAGVIEHVPFDYESLKELHRVLKPSGRLILTWIPNVLSIHEWWFRHQGQRFHLRLYSKSQVSDLLLHSGFRPLIVGYQDRIDILPVDGGVYRVPGAVLRWIRPLLRAMAYHRLAGALCAVAERVATI
jgi:SAM-dependent methyltransferase